ncbi:MAG: M48 family metalloprotease [Pseudomonadota bacterium]
MGKKTRQFLYLFFLLTLLIPAKSNAAGVSLIRDAEIEDFLYDLTKPIFKAANLKPENIKIYIVGDSTLNAFVAGGQNVFINTGLITKYSDPNVLIGVIAHETGHIAAGHLARSSEDMTNAGNAMLLSYIAGIAAAATAHPDAGMAIIMGGSQIAQRSALKFTRTQEEAADSLALKYLSITHNSADGLLELLEFFGAEEREYKNQIDEYALTHPVSKKRINFIKANSKNFSKGEDPALKKRLERIIVKLNAFLDDPDQTLKTYNKDDQNSKYASAIAYYKKGKTKQAIATVDNLIALNSKDGYLYDLKGQILSESGDQKNAIIAYNQAIQLNSNNNLARISLASAIINLDSGDKKITDFAIENLLIALKKEKSDGNIYKQLAKAYDQNHDLGRSYLALAQMSLMEESLEKTKKYIKLARENLNKNDKINLLLLDDIEQFSKKLKDKKTLDSL